MKKKLFLLFSICVLVFQFVFAGCTKEDVSVIQEQISSQDVVEQIEGLLDENNSEGTELQEFPVNMFDIVVDEAEATFPIVTINTENGAEIVSKEDYLVCTVSTSNCDDKYVLSEESVKIKGRGNSTWGYEKKPYKLKFDSKVDLFGNGKAKTWTLIANYNDKSLSRNLIAYNIARVIGLNNTTTTQSVHLMLNGEYKGVYLVCEQQEVGKTRIDIEDGLDNVNTGYLLELDERAPSEGIEGVDYFMFNGQPYAIKSPDVEDKLWNSDFVDYIQDYVAQCYSAILSDDYCAIEELIDTESFAKCYIVHELMNCCDVGFSSFYMYKDKNGKLTCGSVWDFDISSGNCDYNSSVVDWSCMFARSANCWYNKLLGHTEFEELVAEILHENKNVIIDTINSVVEEQLNATYDNELNFEVWNIMGIYVWPNTEELVKIDTWKGQLTYLHSWLHLSLDSMLKEYTVSNVE